MDSAVVTIIVLVLGVLFFGANFLDKKAEEKRDVISQQELVGVEKCFKKGQLPYFILLTNGTKVFDCVNK